MLLAKVCRNSTGTIQEGPKVVLIFSELFFISHLNPFAVAIVTVTNGHCPRTQLCLEYILLKT